MSDLLGIGASAVSTYRNALAVVGDNVANAETPGYARRDIVISENAAVGGSPLSRNILSSGGSVASGVTRAWDAFKAGDARDAVSDDARTSTAATWLGTAGDAIDDGDAGVGAKVSAVFSAGTTLAGDPTSKTARNQMVSALGDATSAISASAAKLAKISGGIADAAGGGVTAVNNDLAALAKVNVAIGRASDGTDAKAVLADQRDKLLDDIAGKIGITAAVASDGSAVVSLAGSTGVTLLRGSAAALVGMGQGADGRLAFTVSAGRDVASVIPTGGALAGLAAAASGVADSRAGLDGIAADFAAKINGWNANGKTAAGAAGQPLLATGGGAAGLALAAGVTGDAIAAAGNDGTANGNLLALGDLRGPDGTEARVATLVGVNAQALASVKSQAAAAATRKSAALVARDDTSGVSLDQEAAQLVRYQQAYDGSAKIIQAAQSSLQAILALF